MAIFTGASEVGSTKFGSTPGGGGPAGTKQRSVGVAVILFDAFQKLMIRKEDVVFHRFTEV